MQKNRDLLSERKLLSIVLASAVVLLCKRLSIEHRHVIWFVVIASFVVIAAVWLTVPSLGPILSIPVEQGETHRIMTAPLMDRDHYVGLVTKLNRVSQTIYASPSRLPLFATLVWAAGVLFFLLPLMLGRFTLMVMGREAVPCRNPDHSALAKKLEAMIGIRQDVAMLTSDRCSVPFTYGLKKPVIVLPVRKERWTKRQLEAVLIHELAHIRRRDCLTQITARVICGLFWFVPLIWIAYARMQREQEKACDGCVIDAGIKPVEYAGHIVDLVRFSKGHILLPGISTAMGMKSMLNERIQSVLSLKPNRISLKKKHLWGLLIVCVGLLAPILAVTVGLKASVYEKALYGTWVNTGYSGKIVHFQKIIIDPVDLTLQWYYKSEATRPDCKHSPYTIMEKWTDSEGNAWYKIEWMAEGDAGKYYELSRVSQSGMTLEFVNLQSRHGWPTEIDPSHPSYRIYQRER